MAAEVNARYNKQPALSFTLPISCQVCLGKVKSPVLCPNNHVFCSPCLDIWLQKTKQCPACRVSMTAGKQIMGGLRHGEDDSEKLTNPDLRKARFDLLYKEFENEFERMQSELQLLKTENQILKQQSRKDGQTDTKYGESSSSDKNGLLVLTKKLQDASKQYEKVKGELQRLKQENSNLKDENVGLNRENQNLRQELAGRSPHRYGRTTVAALESKLASAEKDVTRLTKALERSDKYIEELEKELEGSRGGSTKGFNSTAATKGDAYISNGELDPRKVSSESKVSSAGYRPSEDNPSKRKLFTDDRGSSSSGERYKYYEHGDYSTDTYLDYKSSGKDIQPSAKNDNSSKDGKKRVTFDMEKNTHSTLSFDLEMPSPLKNSANRSNLSINGRASPVKGVLKKSNSKSSDKSSDNLSTDLSKTLEDSLSSSYNGKPSTRYSKDDDLLYTKGRSSDQKSDSDVASSRKRYSADDSILDQPREFRSSASANDYSSKSRDNYGSRYESTSKYYESKGDSDSKRSKDRNLDLEELDDTQYIESELDELNISLTPEFTDCMKILNRAEKKVHTRDSDIEDAAAHSSRYSSISDKNQDAAFRSSTGSLGTFKSTDSRDDVLSDYTKSDQSRFTSSLDSYSRGRHVRSGSLDNLYVGKPSGLTDRPSSALPTTANMLDPSIQKRYSSGLTTGRTSLTRAPSLDNLLMNRPGSKYSSDDPGMSRPGYLYSGHRLYGENEVTSKVGGPLAVKHSGADFGSGAGDRADRQSTFDSVLQARAKSLGADTVSTSVSSAMKSVDVDRNFGGTGRMTSSLPPPEPELDRKFISGHVTPTIPTHMEYMASSTGPDRYASSSTSGRLTPTLTMTNTTDYTSRAQYGEGKTSDLALKPPSGARQGDPSSRSTIPNNPSYTTNHAAYNTNPASYNTNPSTLSSASNYSSQLSHKYGDGTSGVNGVGGGYDSQSGTVFSSSALSSQYDYKSEPVSSYRSDEKYSQATYSDRNYKDGTDFSNFSTKIGSSSNSGVSNMYSSTSSNPPTSSSSFAGTSLGSSAAYSVPYLPTSLSGASSSSSYTSNPLSLPSSSSISSSSSYPSSHPSSTYTSKPLDPISEAGHYSYVSNVSGDYSRNDTFALPEPKKRLFDSSDDLDMSVSPIKTNKRF